VTSSTLLGDPPSNETIDVFYIKRNFVSLRMGYVNLKQKLFYEIIWY